MNAKEEKKVDIMRGNFFGGFSQVSRDWDDQTKEKSQITWTTDSTCRLCPLTRNLISLIYLSNYTESVFACCWVKRFRPNEQIHQNKKADEINRNHTPRFTNGVTEVKYTIIFSFVSFFLCCSKKGKINANVLKSLSCKYKCATIFIWIHGTI